MFSPLPFPPPFNVWSKRPDSSNFMANGNNIEKEARGMEMFPTLKGIGRSVPTVLKLIVVSFQIDKFQFDFKRN